METLVESRLYADIHSRELPQDVLDDLRPDERARMKYWGRAFQSVVKLSRTIVVVRRAGTGRPLLALGGLALNPLARDAELWMVPTNELRMEYLLEVRELFWELFPKLRYNKTFYAKAQGHRNARFIEFFGGRLVEEGPNYKLYEMD